MVWPNTLLSLPAEGRRGNLNHLKERYIWAQIRILHETDKAILVDNGMRIWVERSEAFCPLLSESRRDRATKWRRVAVLGRT